LLLQYKLKSKYFIPGAVQYIYSHFSACCCRKSPEIRYYITLWPHRLILKNSWTLCKDTQHDYQHQHSPSSMGQVSSQENFSVIFRCFQHSVKQSPSLSP